MAGKWNKAVSRDFPALVSSLPPRWELSHEKSEKVEELEIYKFASKKYNVKNYTALIQGVSR